MIKRFTKIGPGGMAHVYLAHEISLDRDVALKLLPKEFQHDKDFSERFKREAQIAARLEHPNIIRIFQISDNPDICYFVMNYITGGSLGDHIIKRGAVPVKYIGRWGMDICSALSYAHTHGVIHRDLKPDNVMINQNGDAIVMDFGIARAAQESRLTRKGQIIGSPHYMSPEQARGEVNDALKSHALPPGSLSYIKEKKDRTQKWKSSQIIDILSKIPLFKELTVEQIKKNFQSAP